MLGFDDPEELSLAGLLHDVGKVIIAHEAPDAARRIQESVAHEGGLVVDAETRVLGFTHADVGEWLLSR